MIDTICPQKLVFVTSDGPKTSQDEPNVLLQSDRMKVPFDPLYLRRVNPKLEFFR